MKPHTHTRVHGHEIRAFLGRGKSAYSYRITYEGRDAVLKDIHHEKVHNYRFSDKLAHEVNGYERLRHAGLNVPRLLYVDWDNEYLIKEYIEGPTLLKTVASSVVPIDCYLSHLFQIAALEQAGINLDYFPANFICTQDGLRYIDYEANDYEGRWNFENWGVHLWFNNKGCRDYHLHGDLTTLVTKTGDAIVQEEATAFLRELRGLDPKELLRWHPLGEYRLQRLQDGMAASTYRLVGPEESLVLKLYDASYDEERFLSEVRSFRSRPELHPPLRTVLHPRPNRTMGLLMTFVESVLEHIDLRNPDDVEWVMEPYVTLLHRLHKSEMRSSSQEYLRMELDAIQSTCIQHPVLSRAWTWLNDRLDTIAPRMAVMVHGDYHPWNVLIDGTRRAWMIDRKERWSDVRYDVYWSAMLMERSGFPLFAKRFLEFYQVIDDTIVQDRIFFEVFTSCAWMVSVLAKDEEPSMFLTGQLALASEHIEARIE